MAEKNQNNTELENVLKELNHGLKKDEKGKEAESVNEKKALNDTDKENTDTHASNVSKDVDVSLIDLDKKEKKRFKAKLKREHGTAIARVKDKKKEQHNKKQRNTVILGIVVSFFTIIGIISSVISTVSFTGDIISSKKLKEKLAKEVFPLVIIDVPEFEDPESLDSSAVIAASIWKFIISEDDKSKYKTDNYGAIYLPATDVENYVRRLFGNNVEIVHQSIDDSSVQMSYSEESGFYIIDSTPKYLPYTPRVESVNRSGNIYTLKVSYIMPDALWNLENDLYSKKADKVMEYKLKKIDDDYQVLSVKQLENDHTVDVSSDQTSSTMSGPDEENGVSSDIVSSSASSEKTSSTESK